MLAFTRGRWMNSLAQLVKSAREAKGWSQAEAADRMDVSKGWVGQVEAGLIKRPKTIYLDKLEKHLGIGRDEMARAMGVIGPAVSVDVLAEIRRIRRIADPKKRAAELRALSPELYAEIEAMAQEMVRLTFLRAQE